jgi:membrane-associated phospholipid phosphatase
MKYFRRFSLLVFLLCISALYFPLNQFLTHGYNLKTPLDIYIPLVPIFAVPYLLFIPYWIGAFLFFAWKMHDRVFRALMIGSIGAVAIATLVYFLFPTYTDRPSISITDWDSELLNMIYSHDNVFNAFPSGHVLYTTIIALFGITWHPKLKFAYCGSVVLVILGTLLTGQHHLVDPIGGFALGLLAYRFGIWTEYGRKGIRRTLVINA